VAGGGYGEGYRQLVGEWLAPDIVALSGGIHGGERMWVSRGIRGGERMWVSVMWSTVAMGAGSH
jgi:hypothetical protein